MLYGTGLDSAHDNASVLISIVYATSNRAIVGVAIEREVEGDLVHGDIGQGLPFRAGSFDAAIRYHTTIFHSSTGLLFALLFESAAYSAPLACSVCLLYSGCVTRTPRSTYPNAD